MIPERGEILNVGIVVVKRALKSIWQSHQWLPYAVLPVPADTPDWTLLRREGLDEIWYAGAIPLELHPIETAHYRDNLNDDSPKLWVVMRTNTPEPPFELVLVTADPSEGEGATEGAGEIVEPVAMPSSIVERLIGFYDANHIERHFFKRKRDRADPDARGKRAHGNVRAASEANSLRNEDED
jgi:hypothetical protein